MDGERSHARHREHLIQIGVALTVVALALPGAGADIAAWIAPDVPMLFAEDGIAVDAGDHVVVPEVYRVSGEIENLRARKVLFCQNHFHMHRGLDGRASWQEMGVRDAIACSGVVAEAVRRCLGFGEVPVIRCAIDTALFRPRPKRLQVFTLQGKIRDELPLIRDYFCRAFPHLADVPWRGLDGAPQTAVAEAMGASAVCLSLSRREGLGLPPLEAMAAGGVVAGFHGVGGREYATPENGLWAEEEDLVGCALRLGEAITLCRDDPAAAERYRDAGRRTVARFGMDGLRADLLGYWSRRLDRPDAA